MLEENRKQGIQTIQQTAIIDFTGEDNLTNVTNDQLRIIGGVVAARDDDQALQDEWECIDKT